MRRADLILGLVATAVGAYALQQALHLAMFAQSGVPGPGFLPRLVSGLLVGLGVLLTVLSLRSRRGSGPAAVNDPASATSGPEADIAPAVRADPAVGADPAVHAGAAIAEAGGPARRVAGKQLRAGSVWLLFALAIPLVAVLGFVPAAALFVFVLLFTVERRRNWRAVLVAVALPVATSVVFTDLFGIQLPQGLLGHLPLGI